MRYFLINCHPHQHEKLQNNCKYRKLLCKELGILIGDFDLKMSCLKSFKMESTDKHKIQIIYEVHLLLVWTGVTGIRVIISLYNFASTKTCRTFHSSKIIYQVFIEHIVTGLKYYEVLKRDFVPQGSSSQCDSEVVVDAG